MSDLARFKQETPLGRRMLLRLTKAALKRIPVIGPAYEMVDEVVLAGMAEQEQERVNNLVQLMYANLEPLMRQLENEDLPDEALENRFAEQGVRSRLDRFAEEVKGRQEYFEALTRRISSQVGEHREKIEELTLEVATLGRSLEIGVQFKYVCESVKHRLSIQGSVEDLYDNWEKISEAGGQGVLYRAHRKGSKADHGMVVKALKQTSAGDGKAIQRFLLEGFFSSQMVHPNIVRVTDYGGFLASGEYFIEMEDLGQTTLKDWCRENPFVGENLDAYSGLILQALSGLSYIHGQNLVHRDVKPSNFMVVGEALKMIDFGSVKSLEADENLKAGRTMTAAGEMVGTPQYMSPEQFDKGYARISDKTDVYGLGVTLFEVFTGQLPFQADSVMGYARAHTQTPAPRPSSVNPRIGGWLDALILKMLAKRPQERSSLETVRLCLEERRPQNAEKMMSDVSARVMQSFRSGLSEDAEQSIRATLKALENLMLGALAGLEKKLREFIVETETDLAKLRLRKGRGEVARAFNPLLCPNLKCDEALREDQVKCPACRTSWKIPCVCEKNKQTAYQKEKCQQCRDKRPIGLEYKQRHSLLITMDLCLEARDYVSAVAYYNFFPQLQKDPQVSEKYEQAVSLQKEVEEAAARQAQERIRKGIETIRQDGKAEGENMKGQRPAKEQEERQGKIAELEKKIALGNFTDALEYYEERFPKHLKDEKTKEVRDRAWDELSREELDKAKELAKAKKYGDAMKILEPMAEGEPTACFRRTVEGIADEVGESCRNEGNWGKAIEAWQFGIELLHESAALENKEKELERAWQKLKELGSKASQILEKRESGGVAAEGDLAEVEKLLQDEAFFVAIPVELQEEYGKAALRLRAWQWLEAGEETLSRGDLGEAEKLLRDGVFFQNLPQAVEEGHLLQLGRLETARQKRGVTGKLRYLTRRAEKEKEDRQQAKARYEEEKKTAARQDPRKEYERRYLEQKRKEEERRRKEEEDHRRKEEEERRRKELSAKVPQLEEILTSGFSYVREESYTCGKIGKTVQEFRHEKTGLEFVYIPGGSFEMGGKKDDEKPVHEVALSAYLIGKYPVTQAVWKKVMGDNPSKFKGDRHPVEMVSWEDCRKFCEKVGLRLPSEAQWEYACRAGSAGEYCFGDDESQLKKYAWYDARSQLRDYAWYDVNSVSQTYPAGQREANAFGLYDVHGNVWEWCADWYGTYPGDKVTDPEGPSTGSLRVDRGGGWRDNAACCRCAFRSYLSADRRSGGLGFRVSKSLSGK